MADHDDPISDRDHDRERLAKVLVELRDAITLLVEDLSRGVCLSGESVERWLVFVDLVSNIIPLCRRHVLQFGAVEPLWRGECQHASKGRL